MKHVGSNYESVKGLNKREVAKLIRQDLKKAGFKTKVRLSRFAGGCAIDVTVDQVWLDSRAAGDKDVEKLILESIQKVAKSYQYEEIDWMTDYFNCSFYTSVQVQPLNSSP